MSSQIINKIGRQLPERSNGYRKIQAIYTEYNWEFYRSQLDAQWGKFFTDNRVNFVYEPKGFHYWIPDFLLPKTNRLIEIKPTIEIALKEMPSHFNGIKEAYLSGIYTFIIVGLPEGIPVINNSRWNGNGKGIKILNNVFVVDCNIMTNANCEIVPWNDFIILQ